MRRPRSYWASRIEIEQELDRPFVYIARMVYGPEGEKGTDIISIADPANPEVIYRWRIENQDLHLGTGGMDLKYFKWNDRHAHSNGRVLLYATTEGHAVNVYDLGDVVEDRPAEALVGTVPAGPGNNPRASYHDMYVAYQVDSGQDRFVVAETEYRYAPLRIFDLQPGLDVEVHNISVPISAWTADWRHLVHNHEIRWPYVFVSGYMDGLIVISDMTTGFWAFRMDGFLGWNGADWGVPDVSSAQKWLDSGR